MATKCPTTKHFTTARVAGEIVFLGYENNAEHLVPSEGQKVEFAREVRFCKKDGGFVVETERKGEIVGDCIRFPWYDGNLHRKIGSLDAGQEGWLMPLKKT